MQSRPYPPSLLDLPLVQLQPRCRQPPAQPSVTGAPPQSIRQHPAPRAQPYQPRSAIAAPQHPVCTPGSPQAVPAQHDLGSSTATQTPSEQSGASPTAQPTARVYRVRKRRTFQRPGSQRANADSLSRIIDKVTIGNVTSDPVDWPLVQQADPDIGFVYDLVANSTSAPSPESISDRSPDVKTLCAQFASLTFSSDGTLCRTFRPQGSATPILQKVVPYSLRDQLADEYHKGINGGHLGTRRAKLKLQQRFYWPRWGTSIHLAKQRCAQCAQYQRTRPQRQGQLQPMLVGAPWERIGVDVTGPHPTSARGHSYILTVIDHFSKWVEVMPMRNQEAATVAKLLFDRVICTHGCPKQILTDQGPNFEGQLFQELCRLLAIDKIRTTAYRPSTNGCVERFHSTMHSLIARWIDQDHRNWDKTLPAVAFAYRTTVHESTGFTPFFLMYGREARVPADAVYGDPSPTQTSSASPVDTLVHTLHDAYTTARENLGRAARRRKDRYDLRARPARFSVGDKVWCYVPRRKQGRYQKWRRLYQGPFTVTKQLGPVTYEIQRNPRSRPWNVHVDKLKPCVEPLTQPSEPDCQDEPPDDNSSMDMPAAVQRPRRVTRLPARYRDSPPVAQTLSPSVHLVNSM